MINLESGWFSDKRWQYVSEILEADPYAVRARIESLWHFCFLQRKDVLTAQEIKVQAAWRKSDFAAALVEADLAEPLGSGYRMKGVAKRIEWLLKKDEASSRGGKASAQRPRDAKGRLLPRGVQVDLGPGPSEVQVETSQGPSPSNPIVLVPVLETALATETILPKTPPSSSRVHAVDRDIDGGGDDELWHKIDQSPLAAIGAGQIEPLGLAKVRATTELWADDVERSIAYFAFDVRHNGKFVKDNLSNPTGLLVSYLLRGGYPKPRNFIEEVASVRRTS